MASGALAGSTRTQQIYASSRRSCYGTPEIYFPKPIDNSRLVKVDDPQRKRELRMLTVALGVMFAIVMVYAWQHFTAIEYGYRIEAMKSQRDMLAEANRQLRLEEARLRDPERIDAMAHRMGLQVPEAGQVLRLEPASGEEAGPIMARAGDVMVISAAR
ncbi:MAG TPA: cell division protein FtsL [Terriglobales bacterium]|nr:cell division protein FtsL [Terriglobales bacterium]